MRSRINKIHENGNLDIIRKSLLNGIRLDGHKNDETEFKKENVSTDFGDVSSNILFSLIENSPDIISRFDRNFKHVFINKAIEKYIQIPYSSWIGKTQKEMDMPNDLVELWDKNLKRVFDYGELVNFEFVFITQAGERTYDSLLVPEHDANKEVKYVLSYVRDISALKQAEKLLKSKNSELDAFIYKASHDLKGPLASIIGISNVAKYEVRDKNALKMFEFISESTKRLDALLQDLLEISVISHSELNFEEINIQKLFKDIVLSLKHAPYAKDVDIKIQIDSSVTIVSDYKLLVSIFQNLIENGMKYNSKREAYKMMHIVSKQENGEWLVEISDNGMGISDNYKNRIFEMFFRGNNEVGGTGLGLFIVKNSVTKLKGNISFNSKENIGTHFQLSFPLQKN